MKFTLRNKLGKLAHKQWAGWMKYLFSKGTFNDDGTWTMPKWAVDRWRRQVITDYENLTQEEQESDNIEGDKFIKAINGESRKDKIFYLANEFAKNGEGDIAVSLHAIHNRLY